MTQPVLDRKQTAQAVAWLESVAARATEEAGLLRGQLAADARADYEANGATTWRIPELLRVSLPLSKQTVYVRDGSLFLKWVKLRYPDAIETIEQVRSTWAAKFCARAVDVDLKAAEDRQCTDSATGEVVPGLAVKRAGVPGALTVSVEPEAKKALAEVADLALQRLALEAGPAVPTVLAAAEVAE